MTGPITLVQKSSTTQEHVKIPPKLPKLAVPSTTTAGIPLLYRSALNYFTNSKTVRLICKKRRFTRPHIPRLHHHRLPRTLRSSFLLRYPIGGGTGETHAPPHCNLRTSVPSSPAVDYLKRLRQTCLHWCPSRFVDWLPRH